MKRLIWTSFSILLLAYAGALAQGAKTDDKAEAVLKRAVESLGGERYLQVKTLYATGKFSMMRDGVIISFQTFTDVLVYPDMERTDFKFNGVKNIQTNYRDAGWIFDGAAGVINLQNEQQIKDFKRGLSVSLDNLLRSQWRGKGVFELRRQARGDARQAQRRYQTDDDDGFTVEFEFTAEGLPVKAIYKRTNPDGEESKEEDRYAQFVETNGIKAPYIIDHFSNGVQTSRINYINIEFNKNVPDSIFVKPNTPKEAKKDIKL
ncbi:MAG: hypothetical protein IPK58_19220 [Acidobacteria bacterium]|nr:hypothetical protein [Acidobacteriota bacterium]